MARIFSFALGNLYRWSKSQNRNILIDYAKKLDIVGVEITFASKKELNAFKLSKDNKTWLKKLDYVSIHAPFSLIKKADNQNEIIKQLNIIANIYHEVKAQNVVVHPDNLPESKILRRYDFIVSTENLTHSGFYRAIDLRKVFMRYPSLKLCLDVSHAYFWSKSLTSELVKIFRDRISQIHFSGTYKRQDHQSLRKVTKDFIDSIQPVKKLNVPIVIEEDIKEKSLAYAEKEIEIIKKIFS